MEIFKISLGLSLLLLIAIMVKRLRNRMREMEAHIQQRLGSMEETLRRSIIDSALECVSANALQSLGFKAPVFLGDWSIDLFMARFIVEEVSFDPPQFVLELGGGASTAIIAQTLKNIDKQYLHIAVDHDATYAARTKELLKRNGLAEQVQVWVCPLSAQSTYGTRWYSDLLDRLPDTPIDLLLVDGPPGHEQSMARAPAAPALLRRLAPGALIVLDDTNRSDEKTIFEQWRQLFPGSQFGRTNRGHGMAWLRLPK